jgi:hypothetical protein
LFINHHIKGKDELTTKRRKTRGLRANRENQRTNGENEKNRENPRTEHNRGTKHTEHTRRNELRTNWGNKKQGKNKQTQRGRTNEKNPGKTETTGHRGETDNTQRTLDQRPQTKTRTQEQR